MKCDLHQRIADIIFFGPMHKNSDCRRGTQPDRQDPGAETRQQAAVHQCRFCCRDRQRIFWGGQMNFSDKIYSK